MPVFNDISKMIGMKVPNLKITQCLGIPSSKIVKPLLVGVKTTLLVKKKGDNMTTFIMIFLFVYSIVITLMYFNKKK
ncbi:hypothetical protein K2V56_11630 [Staphylococcus chromogenes]|uniref:hypothetical protein n=1 Tax=Staphylococcus chromogenes TaxID=46126 RepID=UPI001E4940C0|nr:hypothetical protein [Staphylococcus chromogenes]MCD8906086.1 hypothetical protein [Staphylococcus chromogenes]